MAQITTKTFSHLKKGPMTTLLSSPNRSMVDGLNPHNHRAFSHWVMYM